MPSDANFEENSEAIAEKLHEHFQERQQSLVATSNILIFFELMSHCFNFITYGL